MAITIVDSGSKSTGSVAISEQNKLINWLIKKVKDSGVFENFDVIFNDLRTDASCVGIMLNSGAKKTSVYVDGGYDGTIPTSVVFRCVDTVNDTTRLNMIDKINELGVWFEDNIKSDRSINGYSISGVEQINLATISYVDDSGIQDAIADFNIKYSRL